MTEVGLSPDIEPTWKPIPGFDEYQANAAGQVRSLKRARAIVLVATVGPCGFRTVGLLPTGGTRYVCRRVGTLVALAWLGPPPEGQPEVRRLSGVTTDDRLSNLAYGTAAEVAEDHARRAAREEREGAATHCSEGHRYAPSWLGAWGGRLCEDCRQSRLSGNPARAINKARSWARRQERDRRRLASVPPERSQETYRVAVCDCGTSMTVTEPGPLPTRCPDCKRQAQREADRRYRLAHPKPKKVRVYVCECGASTTIIGSGPPRKQCADCAQGRRTEAIK